MATYIAKEKRFEMKTDLIDVSSIRRPDTNWKFIDPAGHLHQWHDQSGPAADYNPSSSYSTPSLVQVRDPSLNFITEDGDVIEGYRLDCRVCGHRDIRPGFTADYTKQYMPGGKHYIIDDVEVSRDEFREALKEATGIDLE